MKFSIGVEYAIHCMVYMVDYKEVRAITVKELSEFQGISESYLSKVYTKLTKAKLVRSVPGVKGGYMLNKEASEITFWDIVAAVEDNSNFFQCAEIRQKNILLDPDNLPPSACENPCLIKIVMNEAQEAMQKSLQSRTLAWLHNEVNTNIYDEQQLQATKDWFSKHEQISK